MHVTVPHCLSYAEAREKMGSHCPRRITEAGTGVFAQPMGSPRGRRSRLGYWLKGALCSWRLLDKDRTVIRSGSFLRMLRSFGISLVCPLEVSYMHESPVKHLSRCSRGFTSGFLNTSELLIPSRTVRGTRRFILLYAKLCVHISRARKEQLLEPPEGY